MKKFFFALVAITVPLTASSSFAEYVYYCELINFVQVGGKSLGPGRVKQNSGNSFKLAIQSDKLKFSAENYVFSEEYNLSGSNSSVLSLEVEFSQKSPTQFLFKQIRYLGSDRRLFSVETIRFNNGELEGVLHLFDGGGVDYSYSKCDKF